MQNDQHVHAHIEAPVRPSSRWRRTLLLLAALETLACAGLIVFLLSQTGSDPLGRAIAQGFAGMFGLLLIFGAAPALLLAWHGRFLVLATGLAIGPPLLLLAMWPRL